MQVAEINNGSRGPLNGVDQTSGKQDGEDMSSKYECQMLEYWREDYLL